MDRLMAVAQRRSKRGAPPPGARAQRPLSALLGGTGVFAFVLDAFSRMVVGRQVASHMRTDLVLDAVRMARGFDGPFVAAFVGCPPPPAIFRSTSQIRPRPPA